MKVFIGKQCIGCFRALCDSGAQVNLIQNRVIQGFQSNAHQSRATLYGIGDESVSVNREITVTIQPWFSDGQTSPELKVSLLILPKSSNWSAVFPQENLQMKEINQISLDPLADPLFWKRGNIPILLGIEAWSSIANGRVYQLNEHLTCQETLWGNVIFGKINSVSNKQTDALIERKAIHALYLEELNKTMQRFWEFEDLPLCS